MNIEQKILTIEMYKALPKISPGDSGFACGTITSIPYFSSISSATICKVAAN